MITISDLPETKLKTFLTELGLLGQLSINGDTFPALNVQLGQYLPESVDANTRSVAVVVSGSNNISTSERYDDVNATIILAGKADRSDLINVKMIAEAFYQTMVDADRDSSGDIMGLVPTGVTGPFYEDSGRVLYEVNTRLLLTRH